MLMLVEKEDHLLILKIHVIDVPNHVLLESIKHAGSYVAVDKNGVRVGTGGPWCEMTVYHE